jgi:hypothetical protein
MLRPSWLGLLLLIAQAPLPAQIGQYPPGSYPPGTYPPGYPGGGIGFPIPHPHKKKSQDAQQQLQSTDGILRRIDDGQVVLQADDTRILNFKRTDTTKFMKNGDKVKPSTLIPGDHFTVEASQDDQGFLTAVNVIWQQDGTAAERKAATEPVETSVAKGSGGNGDGDPDRPRLRRADSDSSSQASETPKAATSDASKPASPSAQPSPSAQATPTGQPAPATQPAQAAQPAETTQAAAEPSPADLNAPVKEEVPAVKIDSDDEGPPVLQRGKAAHKAASNPPPAQEPQLSASNTPPSSSGASPAAAVASEPEERTSGPDNRRPEEVAIEEARAAAGSFLQSLPNYVCQEYMARFVSNSHPASWQPQDVVSTEVVYENYHESYRNVSVNGKATKKGMEDLSGSWSTGEFGSVLADLFSPATAADFQFRHESRSGGRSSLVYDFSVEREHSHWKIMVASQSVLPAYKGSVWVDKETKRVLRVEMEAVRLPEAFPADTVESATDYEFVRFGDRQFLVPVHAESLSCERGTNNCSRNSIDFRNYHKYEGESTIIFK